MVGNRDIFLDRTKAEQFTLQLNHCGIQACVPGYNYGFALRTYHLIHFVLEGRGSLHTDSRQEFQLHRGQAFFIPAGSSGRYQASAEDPWTYFWIGFYADTRNPLLEQLFSSGPVIDLLIPIQELEQMFLSIAAVTDARVSGLKAYEEKDFPGEQFFTITDLSKSLEANSRMLHLFSRLVETQADHQTPSMKGLNPAADAKAYINACYSEPVKILDIANALHVHPNYLSTVFKKTYGQTPSAYMRSLRMEQAAMLLHLTDYSIAAVARAVGYANTFQFSAAFKSHYHVSPTLYRKQK